MVEEAKLKVKKAHHAVEMKKEEAEEEIEEQKEAEEEKIAEKAHKLKVKKAKVEAPPPQPAAKKKPNPFRAFEERWERRATHKRSAAAEKQLLAKYGGREFRDDDGAYVISTDNLEWCDGEWTVLAEKKRAPSKKQRKEEYEGYCVNAQLRKMIARSLPARDVQRK